MKSDLEGLGRFKRFRYFGKVISGKDVFVHFGYRVFVPFSKNDVRLVG